MSAITLPQTLAIYYGFPSLVNGASGNIATAVNTFKDYDFVVFGSGLEDPGHSDHANLVSILNDAQMATVKTFGYIDATLNLSEIQDKIDLWAAMGPIHGIFLDRFGYDFLTTDGRNRQNSMVWSIHNANSGGNDMVAFVNAWDPDDVFSSAVDPTNNPTGEDPEIGAGDIYLLESYQIINGAYQSEADWRSRSDKVASYKSGNFSNTLIASITTNDSSAYDQAKMDYAYRSAVGDELDLFGWGEELFSASGSQQNNLPWRTRTNIDGTQFLSAWQQNGNVWTRQTNLGILVDTANDTSSNLL